MEKNVKILFKKSGFWIGVLAVGLLVGLSLQFVRAWTEPATAPPGGNLSAPINISNTPQTKGGGLFLNSGGNRIGLVVERGNVGIGTNTPNESKGLNGFLDVQDVWLRGISKWASELGGGGGGYAPGSQTFSAYGPISFTVPPNVTKLTVDVWGAGGGGGSARCFITYFGTTYCVNGGSGAGGGYSRGELTVIPGQVITGYVGYGGNPGLVQATQPFGSANYNMWYGATGETSSFGSLRATGGGGGRDIDLYWNDGSLLGAGDCTFTYALDGYRSPAGTGSGGSISNSSGAGGKPCTGPICLAYAEVPTEGGVTNGGCTWWRPVDVSGGAGGGYQFGPPAGGAGGAANSNGSQPGGGGGGGQLSGEFPVRGGRGGDGRVVVTW